MNYIAPDRITGNIHAKPTVALTKSSDFEEIFGNTDVFSDLYGKAASHVNASRYEDAIIFSDAINYLSRNGFGSASHLVTDADTVADLSCAANFIKSMALVNIGQNKSYD